MPGMFEKPRRWWHGAHLLRVGLGLLFLFAGVLKLVDLPSFLRDVLAYNMVAGPAAGWLAVILPVFEVVVGLCLVLGRLRAGSFAAVMAMAVLFLFVHGYALSRGLEVRCGCFGAMPASTVTMVGVNIALLLAAGWLLLDDFKTGTVEKPKYKFSRDLFKG